MNLLPIGLMFLTLACLPACKTTAPGNEESRPLQAAEASAHLDGYKRSVAQVEGESLNLSEEYNSYADALGEYKLSRPYTSPQSDEDRMLKELVDTASLLEQEDIKAQIKAHAFSKVQVQVDQHFDQAAAQANQFLGIDANSLPPNLALTDNSALSKQDLRQGAAATMIIFGSLGVVTAFATKTRWRRLALVGASAWPLTVGIILLANNDPSKGTLIAGQTFMSGLTALSGLAALLLGGYTAALVSGKLRVEKAADLTPAGLEAKLAKALAARSVTGQAVHAVQEKVEHLDSHKVAITASAAGFMGLAVLTAGLAIWTENLKLASSTLTPQEKLISRLGRAYIAFKKLEA